MNKFLRIEVFGFPINNLLPISFAIYQLQTTLESHYGIGRVLVLNISSLSGLSKSRAEVKLSVDGTDIKTILSNFEDGSITHGQSKLTARALDDTVNEFDEDGVKIYFGCQVSTMFMDQLYTNENATVKFGFGFHKFYFIVWHDNTRYKFVLDRSNIRNFHLPHSQDGFGRCLVFQLSGGSRIYEQLTRGSNWWSRTTDFTPDSAIGQSSHIALEFPRNFNFGMLASYLVNDTTNHPKFEIMRGRGFSKIGELVPILECHANIPYRILFKICELVQYGVIPGPLLTDCFYQLCVPSSQGSTSSKIESALDNLKFVNKCYQPVASLLDLYAKEASTISHAEDNLAYIRKVYITPSKVYFTGQDIKVSESNCVLRKYSRYAESFIRVSFMDEESKKIGKADYSAKIEARVLSILGNGIQIGNKSFEFLAFSASQLRESSLWMFSPIDGVTPAEIRRWMGDFKSIRCVAKYASRLGQLLSLSKGTFNVDKQEYEIIQDIEVVSNGVRYTFSDGIGKISSEFARKVAEKCGFDNDYHPSCFQIRYGGFKGVVAVDPTSSIKLSLRNSMCKFDSESTELSVLEVSKYQPLYLNSQLILLLSSLGVEDQVFLRKQQEMFELLEEIQWDPTRAQHALIAMPTGLDAIMKVMLAWYKPNKEPFLKMMLEAYRAHKLVQMRKKARIFVPDGRNIMGCLDEKRVLKYGEVFVQLSGSGDSNNRTILTGKVGVAKSPCMHPGDVRVLKAVDVEGLEHLVDCIVFPQQGHRPHPNECSGSDLDGDMYFVWWDADLIPPEQVEPADYTPTPPTEVDHDVTIEEVVKYFSSYNRKASTVGIISIHHMALADWDGQKANSSRCKELAKLFSAAIDAPKTGADVEIPRALKAKEFPDFLEKHPNITYESTEVLGKLYRNAKHKELTISPLKQEMLEYDPDLIVEGYDSHIPKARELKKKYDDKLRSLMDHYGIETEAELLSCSIKSMSKHYDALEWSDTQEVRLAVESLMNEAREWFKQLVSVPGNNEFKIASAWYMATYHSWFWKQNANSVVGGPFVSFPWSVHETLFKIKRRSRNVAV